MLQSETHGDDRYDRKPLEVPETACQLRVMYLPRIAVTSSSAGGIEQLPQSADAYDGFTV